MKSLRKRISKGTKIDGFSKKKPVAVTFTSLQVYEELFTRESNQMLSISPEKIKKTLG